MNDVGFTFGEVRMHWNDEIKTQMFLSLHNMQLIFKMKFRRRLDLGVVSDGEEDLHGCAEADLAIDLDGPVCTPLQGGTPTNVQ